MSRLAVLLVAMLVGLSDALSPVATVKMFVAQFCTKQCVPACEMLSGTWDFTVPVPPFPQASVNASECTTLCTAAPASSFCSAHYLDTHCHEMGTTGSVTFSLQIGSVSKNASDPRTNCIFVVDDAMYVELDAAGKISLLREYYNASAYQDMLAWCPGAPSPHVRLTTPLQLTRSAAGAASTVAPPPNSIAPRVVNDSSALALCIGMLNQYSHRQCQNLGDYTAPNFRFHYSGGADGGVDLEFFTNNCNVPNPPEWIGVQSSFSENVTSAYWWDLYATASINPITGNPCSTIQKEAYHCTAVQTPAGLRLSHVHDTFDETAYTDFAERCGLGGSTRWGTLGHLVDEPGSATF